MGSLKPRRNDARSRGSARSHATLHGLRARDYAELRKLVDERRKELRMKMWEVDVDAELQDGYFAKIICGLRNFGPDTLGKILAALDVEIVLMPRYSAPSAESNIFRCPNG